MALRPGAGYDSDPRGQLHHPVTTSMTDAARALAVTSILVAFAMIRLSRHAIQSDPTSPTRLVAELRLAQFAALVLALVAGTYIGFSLAQAATAGSGVDIALAIGFLMLASVAVTQSPHIALAMLAVGFGGHAIVDLIHGANVLPADSLPDWYATACAIYDVVMAGVCYLPIVRRA